MSPLLTKGKMIMKKIKGFTITKLTLTGFKCFEGTVSFDLGDTTYITASNGKGKSSIADAVAFAFVGTPFFGEKGLDRLQNKDTQEMTVSVDFIDDTGKSHNLTRTRKRDTSIVFDGITIKQSDLNAAFGGRDIFLSIFNPLYFVNVLGDGGKNLLEKLLPVVKHEDVMASLSPYSQEVLEGKSLLSPELFIKEQRSVLKELNETLISYRGQEELLNRQREERAAKLEELKEAIDGISIELEELSMIRGEGRDPEEEKAILEGLRKQRADLLSGAADDNDDKAIQEVMEEIKKLEKSIAKLAAEQYASSYTAQIAEAEAGLKVLYVEHERFKTALGNTVIGYKCPVCASVVTKENVDSIREDLQQRMSALVNDGKAAKNNLADIKAKDDAARDEFEKQKEETLGKENEKLEELNQQLQEMNVSRELDREDYGERISELEIRISEQESRISNGNWSQEQALRFAELSEKKKGYEAKIEALSNVVDHDFTELIAGTEAEITRVKRLINEAIQYMAKRIELMLGGLKMSSTEIVLTELIKTTGELKDCFHFSYDGRDYKYLSLSEKVRVGLDIATLIQRLSGRDYPIFVDNCESICTFGSVRLDSQVVIARVAKGQELQVTYRDRERLQAA